MKYVIVTESEYNHLNNKVLRAVSLNEFGVMVELEDENYFIKHGSFKEFIPKDNPLKKVKWPKFS